MYLKIGLGVINISWRFNYEVSKVGGIEGDEGKGQQVYESFSACFQIRKGDRTCIDLVEIARTASVHRFYWTFDDCFEVGFVVPYFCLRD